MTKRIVEIGNPARLSSKNRQLVVERRDFPTASIPFEDLGVLIVDHPAVSFTQRVCKRSPAEVLDEACYPRST